MGSKSFITIVYNFAINMSLSKKAEAAFPLTIQV